MDECFGSILKVMAFAGIPSRIAAEGTLFSEGRVRDAEPGMGGGIPSGVHRADVSPPGEYTAAGILAAAARNWHTCGSSAAVQQRLRSQRVA